MSTDMVRSPAGALMDEAVELAIAEISPYPEKAAFIDADTPFSDRDMNWALDQGFAVVLVSPDGETRTVWPEPAAS